MITRILALSGSPRQESLNGKLLRVAAQGAKEAGAEVSVVCLLDYPLPIYDGDWEAEHGLPEAARTLQTLVSEHHGLLIASPEHNGGYTALLKNAIDWISRKDEADPTLRDVFAGKTAALVSASPNAIGGWRSQFALEMVLRKLDVLVLPISYALAAADRAFDADGNLLAAATETAVKNVGVTLVNMTSVPMTGLATTLR
jgi:NAD(P)H-dependent FMN reductase